MDNKGKQMKQFDKITEKHKKGEIAKLCGVSKKTVTSWSKNDGMKLEKLDSVGFEIVDKEESEVDRAVKTLVNFFGIKVKKQSEGKK